MGYATESTLWQSDAFRQPIKDLISRYYELSDSPQADAGETLASKVFSSDACVKSPQGSFTGSADIAASRENAWKVVESRKHTIDRAFFGQGESPEIVIIGSLFMTFRNGKSLDSPFATHLKLEVASASTSQPLISFMEVYTDLSPAMKLLSN
uniref:NTF2 domain-containing protein n=1 Tax=Bionectria ochroleuca TaxID=29856 RepID=A0A8H7N0Z7_BIOOC